MKTQALNKFTERLPSVFEDFVKPWNEWFDGGNFSRAMNMPAVNITEKKDVYELSLAAPGLKKDDFEIDLDGDMLTISSAKEENNEEKNEKFTRKEYNYSAFSRTFNLPSQVNKEQIKAWYEDGVLHISIPRTATTKSPSAKHIAVN